MNGNLKKALLYVKNTGGGATREHFIEDHAPMGERFWQTLLTDGLVSESSAGRIHLTEAGEKCLERNP